MQTGSSTLLEPETVTKRSFSPRWRVIGHNDDVTPMDFVVMVLMDIFHKSADDAFKLMMEVHETGSSTFYYGTREACELKIEQVKKANHTYGENLVVTMEAIEEES
jgi:ATP-dependent Clp protease adaptor protein ClpS